MVKLPLTLAGLKATKSFSGKGIKTNVTLCFSPNQALLAAKVGATYISPFIGRLDDINLEGMELIEQIRQIYDNYAFTTRNPRGLDPHAQPRDPGGAGRRRRRDDPAGGDLQARRPSADQVRARELREGLEVDGPVDPLVDVLAHHGVIPGSGIHPGSTAVADEGWRSRDARGRE